MIIIRLQVKIQLIIFVFVWLRKFALGKIPLIEETIIGPKLSQQTQCAFYKDIYEIGDKWKPNVEPFGVYHCILCECIAIRRKNQENVKVITKVKCRNFKNDCPKLTCANPILLPDRCCKTCPGDTTNLEDTIASQKLEESLALKNLRKKFFAFLTESSVGHRRNNFTAIREKRNQSMAFFHLNKQRLAFIIKIKSLKKPTYVRFQDLDDTIIEEYIVKNKSINHNFNNEFMIYGSWSNMAKPYRVMIRKSQLKITVSFNANINAKSVLNGIIKKYNLAAQELFKNQTNYFDLLEGHFGKGKVFDEMYNTTSFVAYQENNYLDKKALMDQSVNSIDSNYKCYYEAQIYEEGAQWKNQNDECEMCFCQRGRVKCESEICLKLRCKEQIRIPGQCCPICKNNLAKYASYNNQSCYFEGEKKYHLIGTKWHPFIPPFGFDRCTVCMCTENAQIKCKRNECPTLPCSEKDSYRENPMDCCKKCRAATKSFELIDTMNDQASTDENMEQALMTGSCRFRGKIYANGYEWNPAVYPFGEISCIKCNCKDGKHKCQRLECKPTPPGCLKIIKKNECCPTCANQTSTESGRKRFPQIRF